MEQLNRKKSSQNREEQSEEREEQTHSVQQEEDRDKNVKDVETSKREERKDSFSDLSESDSFELKLSDSEPRYFCVGSWSERRNESAEIQQTRVPNFFFVG